MVIVFVVLIAVLIFVIAAVAVGRETSRLAAQPPRPVFDMDEAVEWIADRLPPDGDGLDQLAVRPDDEVLVVDDEALAYVQVRAREAGRDWTESQIQHVLDVQLAYLQAIGAAGAEREI